MSGVAAGRGNGLARLSRRQGSVEQSRVATGRAVPKPPDMTGRFACRACRTSAEISRPAVIWCSRFPRSLRALEVLWGEGSTRHLCEARFPRRWGGANDDLSGRHDSFVILGDKDAFCIAP